MPEITSSRAYKDGGLLVITVDEAPSSGEFADSSSCCGQPPSRTSRPPPRASPRAAAAGGCAAALPVHQGRTTSQLPYNHFSLLRTIEDLFGLGHIGYARLAAVKPLAAALLGGG